jgi:hypothetical protein
VISGRILARKKGIVNDLIDDLATGRSKFLQGMERHISVLFINQNSESTKLGMHTKHIKKSSLTIWVFKYLLYIIIFTFFGVNLDY